MSDNVDRDSSPSATAIDAATLTSRQCARAACLASDSLDRAELATKPKHARQWRIAGFSALQETRVLVNRAMLELANANPGDVVVASSVAASPDLVPILRALEVFACEEATMTGVDAVKRAAAMLVARFGGGR